MYTLEKDGELQQLRIAAVIAAGSGLPNAASWDKALIIVLFTMSPAH